MTAPVDELEAIAAQLAARVREDGPDENAAWLARMLPDPADRDRLNFVLAAGVPVDRPWRELVAWVDADLPDLVAGNAGNVVELHSGDDEDQGDGQAVDELSVQVAVDRVLNHPGAPAPLLSSVEVSAVVAELYRRRVPIQRIADGLGMSRRLVERYAAGYVRTRRRHAPGYARTRKPRAA